MNEATDYPLDVPVTPGRYESEVLADRVAIRVNANGSADAVVSTGDTTYVSTILDLQHYARTYGPFRRLDES